MKQIIAVFDFDKTLTDRDSLLPFFFFLKGRLLTYLKLFQNLSSLIAFQLGIQSRQKTKEALLASFFADYSYHELQKKAEEYALKNLDYFLKPEAMERLEWHLSQGHRCILISASLELYLKPWGKRIGMEKVLGSRLESEKNGSITGKLEGKNCWGEEKVRRLIEYAGPIEKMILYAYGDSHGDYPILKIANYSFYRCYR